MPSAARAIGSLDKENASLNDVFSCLVQPLLEMNELHSNGTSNFLQLLGRGYFESQGHLRWFITTHYNEPLMQFVSAVQTCAPHIPAAEMFWRLHFTLGTVVFTMASSDALIEIAESDFKEKNDIETVIRKIIPYMAAGVSVPVAEIN